MPSTSRSAIKSLALNDRQRLLVERGEDHTSIKFLSAAGQVTLAVDVTPSGPVLRFESGVMIQTTGPLAIDAQRVVIHGREGLALLTDGDLKLHAAGDLESNARSQSIQAELGDVSLHANDDVKLDGERIRMNC